MLRMSLATSSTPGGLLPLPRPLMTGEVLDAAFRLFRASLLRCLPYSGCAVLALEVPTLYSTFRVGGFDVSLDWMVGGGDAGMFTDRNLVFLISLLLVVLLFGALTLRLDAISKGQKPRVRREIALSLWRWPSAIVATIGALGFPLLLFVLGPAFTNVLPKEALLVVAPILLWPAALFAVALPAFWCDGLGPFEAVAQSVRISCRRSWRMAGALFATACIVTVFYALAAIVIALLSPLLGRADLFLIATVRSVLTLVWGALGVPFVLAMLVVAYDDLKLREQERRGSPR
jgi:membrane-anchored glycerophosphoryl diester phosphodiesterase (GDPDase)